MAAQGNPAPSTAPKETKETKEAREAREAREAAEAMERARRLAANPMRVILEASRVRRGPEGATPAAGGTAVAAAAPAEAAPRPQPAPAAAPAAAPAPAPAPAREPEPPASVISSDLVQARAGTQRAPALDPAALPPPLAVSAVSMPSIEALQPGVFRPTLVRRVDPELPPRVLADLAANTVITADLMLRADGSVAQVNVVTPGPAARAMSRFVVAALQQWRFEPMPAERPWRVELVFNAD